ncbi:hypothetical protein HOF65_04505 [bacterium]|nr:hypothetical protein [bacterium]MBT3853222.1 hypothetical protein [bacterium]MBT4633375.1 hypothetical protein [bacterium]MBT5491394.1 hypothetical protein [bacterium]MBT6779477.1 hypothetical protein [bacterium]
MLFKSIDNTSDLIIECFQHLAHSISMFIVEPAAQIISIFQSVTDHSQPGHLYHLIIDSIIHLRD